MVGGEETAPNQYPFMVTNRFKKKKKKKKHYFLITSSGGTDETQRWII
jgi:hypothetical protein